MSRNFGVVGFGFSQFFIYFIFRTRNSYLNHQYTCVYAILWSVFFWHGRYRIVFIFPYKQYSSFNELIFINAILIHFHILCIGLTLWLCTWHALPEHVINFMNLCSNIPGYVLINICISYCRCSTRLMWWNRYVRSQVVLTR